MNTQAPYDKLWSSHVVREEGGTVLLYIDRHLVHKVTSPRAFEGLKMAGHKLWRINSIVPIADHNTPAGDWDKGIQDPISRLQVDTLDRNIKKFSVLAYLPFMGKSQGIVHAMGPEQDATLPDMTVVCGDSHTSIHGAFDALAHGIGTSEVEHTTATQYITIRKSKSMLIAVEGRLEPDVTARDVALYIIRQTDTTGGTSCAVEFGGEAIRSLSMEGRMALCSITIEAGAHSGMVAVGRATIGYVKDKPFAPKDEARDKTIEYWHTLVSDEGAVFDKEYRFNAGDIGPQVTWGTSPGMVLDVNGKVPNPTEKTDPVKHSGMKRVLEYMGLETDVPLNEIPIGIVLVGSCTSSRIKDLREAVAIAKGRKKADNVQRMLIVFGSDLVKRQAEQEGLDKIFINAGFKWHGPGCSTCLAMNANRLTPSQRCASTPSRNFEGHQGNGGRTHLISPAMAAAVAVTGHSTDTHTMA